MNRLASAPHDFAHDYATIHNDGIIKNITFIVTHDCTCNCVYCYEHNKGSDIMSRETGKRIVDMLFDEYASNSHLINSHNAEGLVLDFIGGEPLLEIELIDYIVDYFIYRCMNENHPWLHRFMISMSSNGTLYGDKRVQAFIRKHVGRLSLSISVDGDKTLHDSCRRLKDGSPTYDLAAYAFRDLKQKYNIGGTKLTLSPQNISYLSEACINMIQEFDLRALHGNPTFEDEWTNEHAGIYYHELKTIADWMVETGRWERTWLSFFSDDIGVPLSSLDNQNFCGGTGKMLAFDVDGKIYPCTRYAPVSIGDEIAHKYILGSIDNGLLCDKSSQNCMACLESITRRSQSTDECWDCPIASGCAWCSAANVELLGSPNKRLTRICPMHKARVLATSYYYNTIYRMLDDSTRFPMNVPRDWGEQIVGEQEYNMLVDLSNA